MPSFDIMVGKELAYTGNRSRFYRHDSVSMVASTRRWTQVFCVVYWVSQHLKKGVMMNAFLIAHFLASCQVFIACGIF